MEDEFEDDLTFTPFDVAPARLTIDLGALADNWRMLKRASGKARTGAAVKGDGYGLGIEAVVPALYDAGCRDLFVATPDEGMLARQCAPDARIFVLSGVWPGVEGQFFSHDLVPVLVSEEQIACWTNATAFGEERPCALMVDTGMNRLGLSVDEALALVDDPTRPASFAPVLVLSHLATASEPGHPLNRRQLESFQLVAGSADGRASFSAPIITSTLPVRGSPSMAARPSTARPIPRAQWSPSRAVSCRCATPGPARPFPMARRIA